MEDGRGEGAHVGRTVGIMELGAAVGSTTGNWEGAKVDFRGVLEVGDRDGANVSVKDGTTVNLMVGIKVGIKEGNLVGIKVGSLEEGKIVGSKDGCSGNSVGDSVIGVVGLSLKNGVGNMDGVQFGKLVGI